MIIGTSAIVATLFLFGFANNESQQNKRTEEYGSIVVSDYNFIEKTANGKTEIIKLQTEKISGGLKGNYNNTSLISELNKMNEEGYEIVNVSTTIFSNNVLREVYLFKRKL